MRAIVSVATTDQFVGLLQRLKRRLSEFDDTPMVSWEHAVPDGTNGSPYSFKLAALKEAERRGFEHLLWLDSSIVPLRPLEPIWERIERKGYWFSENWHGRPNGEWTPDRSKHWTNAEWTAPEAWPAIQQVTEISLFENCIIPQIVGGAFGLNVKSIIGGIFLLGLEKMIQLGALNGDRSIHRHDQTCMSALVYKLRMVPTVPPAYFADDGHQSEETILVSRRGWA